ncbi:hypothetical protein COV16_05340, partial [Candidatus Woesearchaeota archaeon CG10_big_fil_rev_8_21_14_0_10_34_8]
KDLEEKKKKEIEEAKQLLKQAEGEIATGIKQKRLEPIPEIKQEIPDDDLSEDGKQIFKTKKFFTGRTTPEEETEKPEEEDLSLEDQLRKDAPKFQPQPNDEYSLHLALEPIDKIQAQLGNMYHAEQEKGYVNPNEMYDLYKTQEALYDKAKAIEAGAYASQESVADKLDSAQQMIKKLMGHYQSDTGAP